MEHKLIIAGGRDFCNYELLKTAVNTYANSKQNKVSIVSGMAKGADALGYRLAEEYNIKVYEFPANWNKHGKRAGFVRNEEMGNFADSLIAFWDGKSRGTKHMIDFMKQLNKPVTVIPY